MKKRMLALLLAVMMLLAMAACTSSENGSSAAPSSSGTSSADASSSEPADDGEVQPLYFYAWTKEENMTGMIEAFNADFAGKYELIYCKLADAKTLTINTALASGETIDVMTQASSFDLADRATSGAYLGLKQFFDADGLDYATVFNPSIEEVQNIDGDYYAIPYTQPKRRAGKSNLPLRGQGCRPGDDGRRPRPDHRTPGQRLLLQAAQPG